MRRVQAVLWVNDAPDERIGNGDDPDQFHGHVYRGNHGLECVQVSFDSLNGRATRVTFDLVSGEATVHDITDHQTGGEPL